MKRVQIRKVARLGTGHTPSRSVEAYWDPAECTIPWLTLADVWQLRDGSVSVVHETKEKISPLGLANSAAVRHPAGTVAFSRTASVGFSCILGVDMATSQDFVTWTCGPKLDPRYLLWVLRAEREDILRRTQGSTHKTIYMPDIEQLTIPLPSLDDQRRIVQHLDDETSRIDQLIEKKRRMVELLGETFVERARARLTDGLRLIDPLDVRRRDLRSGHEPIKLGWAFRCGSGTTPRSSEARYFDGDIPWLMTGDLTDDVVTEASRSLTPDALRDYSALRVHPKGSLIIAMYGATIGKLGILDIETTVNQACAVLTPRGDVLTEFAFYWLFVFRRELIDRGRGGGQPNISQEILRDIRLACPSPELQTKAVEWLNEHRSLTRKAEAVLLDQIVHLQEHRQCILATAITPEQAAA